MKALARNSDPDTSKEAAESLGDLTDLENKVYEAIASYGAEGCIADEVLVRLPGMAWKSVSPRFRPLKDKGYVVNTGEKRKGASGRNQIVLRAVSPGEVTSQRSTIVFDD